MLSVVQVARWAVVALPLCGVEGKVQAGSVALGGPGAEGRWRYVSKFGFGLGVGQYDVRLRLRTPQSLARDAAVGVEVYLDEDWHRAEALPPCRRAVDSLARKTLRARLRASGEWDAWHLGSVEQRVRSHIWYFALSDCSGPLPDNVEVDFEFRARQEGGSELSVEAQHMPAVHAVVLICLTALLPGYALRCRHFRESAGALHPVVWVLTLAMALQYGAQALQTMHLWRYREDGTGVWVINALAQNLSMVSQVIHTALLIAIAQGYTLLRPKTSDLGLTKPIVAAVLLAHSALVGFGQLRDDAAHKHHENDGAVGWAILGMRLFLLVWFVRAARASHAAAGGLRTKAFLRQFQLAGCAFFLAYPALFVAVQAFAPYLRHPILQVGLLIVQLGSDAWLARLFLSRGAYFSVSTLSTSLLPSSGLGKEC
mmetsp:Transcript_107871/g.327865  ORF Transcript_107871/g.327865 Transcript_107871/m.327865 type:complete len:427 (+) Transcript_107871:86-1366(+)